MLQFAIRKGDREAPMTHSRADDGKVYQQIPTYSKSGQFKPKGWSDLRFALLTDGFSRVFPVFFVLPRTR